MPFVAGQKVRAQELNDLVLGVYLSADVTTVNNGGTNPSWVNATGLSIPLAANASYGLDGWLHWTSSQAADIQFRYTYPTGSTGYWAGVGPRLTEKPTGSGPRVNYVDFGSVSLAASLSFSGDDEVAGFPPPPVYVSAIPRGFIVTSGTSGNLQLRFAQATAQATQTILRRGCWLRVTRLD
jgi:hypothetical protein